MKKYIYRVSCETKENNTWYKWFVDVEANNAKEAKEAAKKLWSRKPHMFSIVAVRYTDNCQIDFTHCWKVVR